MNPAKLEKNLVKIFVVLAAIVFIPLFLFSFLLSYVNVEVSKEYVYMTKDNLILNALSAAAASAVILVVRDRCARFAGKVNIHVLAFAVSAVSVLLCALWAVNSKTAPQADQRLICTAASLLNQGDYSPLEKGQYLAQCPHQLGITTLLRIIFILCGDGNYMAFQLLNALAAGVIVFFSYGIACVLTKNTAVEVLTLMLSFFCLPMYFYTPFVYGELLSTALSAAALYAFLKMQEQSGMKNIFILSLLTAGMLLIRKNTAIILIAMLGVTAVNLVLKRPKKYLFILAGIVLGIVIKSTVISALYDTHIPDDAKEIPAITYIAMGTNDNTVNAGWHDGMNFRLFEQNDYDPELTSEASKEILSAFVDDCVRHPSRGIRFYARKILAQWEAPMYQSLVMNNHIVEEQPPFVKTIYYNKSVWAFMDTCTSIYQFMVYLAVVCLLIHSWRDQKAIGFYVGLIAVYGGFLFSVLWEAKTRYVFPYLIILFPYAAAGLYMFTDDLRIRLRLFFHPSRLGSH